MNYIICIDPGETIGYAVIKYGEIDAPVVYDSDEFVTGPNEVTASSSAMDSLIESIEDLVEKEAVNTANCKIVMEDWEWRATKHSVDARPACAVIGIVQYLYSDNFDIIMQKPVLRKRVSDEDVKRAGLWLKGGRGHMREALRHGLRYLLSQKHLPSMQILMVKTNISDGV